MKGVWFYTKIIICTTILALGFKPFLLYHEANTHCEATGLEAEENVTVLPAETLFAANTVENNILPASVEISTLPPLKPKFTDIANFSASTEKEKMYIQEQLCEQIADDGLVEEEDNLGCKTEKKALAYLNISENKHHTPEYLQDDSNEKDDVVIPQKEKISYEDPKLDPVQEIPSNISIQKDIIEGTLGFVMPSSNLLQGQETSVDSASNTLNDTDPVIDSITEQDDKQIQDSGIECKDIAIGPKIQNNGFIDKNIEVYPLIDKEELLILPESIEDFGPPVGGETIEELLPRTEEDSVEVLDDYLGPPIGNVPMEPGEVVYIFGPPIGGPNQAKDSVAKFRALRLGKIYDANSVLLWKFIVCTDERIVDNGKFISGDIDINFLSWMGLYKIMEVPLPEIYERTGRYVYIFYFDFNKIIREETEEIVISRIEKEHRGEDINVIINGYIKAALDNCKNLTSEWIFKLYRDSVERELVTTSVYLAKYILTEVDRGESVIKLDFGIDGADYDEPWLVQETINHALENEVSIIASAGNSNNDANGHMPANLSGVLPVTAVDGHGMLWIHSGGDISTRANTGSIVPIAADGGEQGTAHACDIIARIAGEILDIYPDVTPEEVILRIINSGHRRIPGTEIGIVDRNRALVERFSLEKIRPKFVLLGIKNETKGKDTINPGDDLILRIYIKNLGASVDGEIHGILIPSSDNPIGAVDIFVGESVYESPQCLSNVANDPCFEMRIDQDLMEDKLYFTLVLKENWYTIGVVPLELDIEREFLLY